MSKNFNKIKFWYPKPWGKEQVKAAVKKGQITEEEYELIVGEPYEP